MSHPQHPQYRLYGLTLRTTRPLRTLTPVVDGGTADVVVELAGPDDTPSAPVAGSEWAPADPEAPAATARTPEGTWHRLRYAGRGHELTFVLDPRGTRVWAAWNERVALADVESLLTGPILSAVLRRRGIPCLHASVVAVDGRAVGFLGAKGAGKSTTALALVQRGAELLSDDVAVLDEDAAGFRVRRGLTTLRMRPEPAAALAGGFDGLRALWSQEDERPRKRVLDVTGDAADDAPLPLAALYVLGARTAPDATARLTTIPTLRALPLLMAHRHMTAVADREGHAHDFAVTGRLAARVPVRELHRPEGLDAIASIADAILADVRPLG